MRVEQGAKMQEKETLDERLPGLFEPDTLLPIQYFEAMRKKHLLEGEKRLVLSVLEDAVECFMKCIDSPTSKGQRLFRDADEWIALEDRHWVFSFDNVCDMLDINPAYLRRGLRRWKERKVAALEQAALARAEAAANPQALAGGAPTELAVSVVKPVEAPKREAPKHEAPKIVAPIAAKTARHRSVKHQSATVARQAARGLHKARA